MIFDKTKIEGAQIIELEKFEDDRGFFVNIWNKNKAKENNLETELTECNIAFNKKKGTIRGFHYQLPPYEGAKLIRCTKGKVWDVTLDLRPNSKTFKEWISVELSESNFKLNYIPSGCGHAYQTLEDNSEVTYLMTQKYMPEYEKGVRFSDPMFNVKWPMTPSEISEKDLSWKLFE